MGVKSRFQITENGIRIRKLISSQTIPFSDIAGILLLDQCILITTRRGEQIAAEEGNMVTLYKAVVTNNISFRDETEHEERHYTREELNGLIAAAAGVATEVANDHVKEHLGEEYSIAAQLLEDPHEINLCFILLRDGCVVTDLPPTVVSEDPARVPGCCTSMLMAWLVEWDTGSCSGRYGIVEELKDPERCRKTQLSEMEFVVGVLKGE